MSSSSTHPISTDPAWITEALEGLPPLLTTREVGQILRIVPRAVPFVVARGGLQALGGRKAGHRMLIPRESVREYLLKMGAA